MGCKVTGHRTVKINSTWANSNLGRLVQVWPGLRGRSFLVPPTLTASNFEALLFTDPIRTALKDLKVLKKHIKSQQAISILSVAFCPLEYP